MLTTLAFDNTASSLFRQLLEPIAFSTKAVDSYTPSSLQSHIDQVHPGGNFAGMTSLAISDAILQYQGSNSDWVQPPVGFGFMADVNLAPLFNIDLLADYPGIGGAWQYFTIDPVTWIQVVYDTATHKLSQFWVSNDNNRVYVEWYKPPGINYQSSDRIKVLNFNSVHTPDPTLYPANLPNSFTEVVPGHYTSNPAFVTVSSSQISPNNTSYIRQYYLSADSVPVGSPGIFEESEAIANPIVAEALTHIVDTNVHISLDLTKVATNKVYSSQYIRHALDPSYYLYNGMGGDAWLDTQGNLQSPILDLPLIQHWIAYGTNGGMVTDPDTGEVIAAPVNNTNEVRCMFTLPLGSMPVVTGDIVLRCLNPQVGFTLLTDHLLPDPV
jgi:hypothetical protein